jgi:exopolysaccharide biosynthesis polyprenyl glycosylphosphotransferase
VIGNPKKIPEVLALLRRKPEWGFHVVDSVTPSEKKVREIFSTQIIDEVFFHVTPEELAKLQPILELCEIHGAPLHFYSDILPLKYSKPRLEFFLDEPVLSYYRKYLSLDQIIMKRLLDLMGGLVGSLLTVLITPGIALLIKLEDGGPIFFSQKQVGVNRRHFTVYKFRTMRVDAPKLRKKLQAKNEMKGNLFKMKDDPRITRVGKWLRKTSLDEFPQFFNVLMGTMSLVGPRPLPVEDMEHYEQHHYRRLRAKPGITGFWQVRGRNKIQSYERMVQLDNRYIDYWSIGLDLSILFQRVAVLTF